MSTVTDHRTGEVTVYAYNALGQMVSWYTFDESTDRQKLRSNYTYDEQERLSIAQSRFAYEFYDPSSDDTFANWIIFSDWYHYDEVTQQLKAVSFSAGEVVAMSDLSHDYLGRLTDKIIYTYINDFDAVWIEQEYTYTSTTQSTATSQIATYYQMLTYGSLPTVMSERTWQYTYDANGNITQIRDGNGVIQYQYHYDDMGQLIREDDRAADRTYVYTYDAAGNRIAKTWYFFTTNETLSGASGTQTYSYKTSDWGDLLASAEGYFYTYDEIGNPIQITDGGYQYELEWNGRELTRYAYGMYDMDTGDYYDGAPSYVYTYTYNADGIRTSKTINGVTHEYLLEGSRVMAERWVQSGTEHLLLFLYDENGSPVAIQYRTDSWEENDFSTFFLETNLFGDVIAIYNETGEKIGSYEYDAWGYHTPATVSGNTTLENNIARNYNPFRYRGYFYDPETGYYYLQSRYYNPQVGRFLNADGVGLLGTNNDLLAYNLYTYGSNNPIANIDPTGTFNWGNFAIAVLGVAAITAASVITAGMAAGALGLTAAGIVTVKTATLVAGSVAGGVAMMDQIREDGEVSDPLEAISESADSSISAAVDSIAGITGKAAKVVVTAGTMAYDIASNTAKDVSGGKSWNSALKRNTEECFITAGVKKGIDYALFPNATDIIENTAKILLPERE